MHIIIQYVIYPELEWNDQGLIVNCCDKHNNGIPYGDCDKHPQTSWNDCKSLSGFAINTSMNQIVLVMFYNHWWYDCHFENHLINNQIFISYPLNEMDLMVHTMNPDYSVFKHEIATSWHEIQWIFPRNITSLYLTNWDFKQSYSDMLPFQENWHGCLNTIKNHVNNKINKMSKKITKTRKKLNVCVFLSVFRIWLQFFYYCVITLDFTEKR